MLSKKIIQTTAAKGKTKRITGAVMSKSDKYLSDVIPACRESFFYRHFARGKDSGQAGMTDKKGL